MHNTSVTNIQLQVKENNGHNAKVTNIQVEVNKNSAHSNKQNKNSNRSQRK